jgi:hypothetical protein
MIFLRMRTTKYALLTNAQKTQLSSVTKIIELQTMLTSTNLAVDHFLVLS